MKDIPGYEGLYAVTEDGKVWSYPKPMGNRVQIRGKFLKVWLVGNGYEMVMLWKGKKPYKFLVHRLIAETYIPNPQEFRTVNHKNGDRRDNRVENLEWCSYKENNHHAWRLGLYTHNKITEKDVRLIRALRLAGNSCREIAKQFGISESNISFICLRKTWKHII